MKAKLWFVIELPDSQSEKGKTFRSRMCLGKESVTPRHYCHLRLEEVHSITSSSCVPSAGRLMESQAADCQGYNLQWWQKVHLLYYAGQAGSYAWQSSHLARRLDNNFVKLSNQIKSLPKEMTNLSQRKREKERRALKWLNCWAEFRNWRWVIGRQRAEGQSLQSKWYVQKAQRCETWRVQGLHKIDNN